MRVEDLVERLSLLGLDQGEAQVFVHLSLMGPSKASDVATALKLHRTETYRVLQALVQRGFAVSTLGRPARFEAVPPEKLFAQLRAAQDAGAKRLSHAETELGAALRALNVNLPKDLSKNTFKVLQGRREIYKVVERMVREAKDSLKSVSTHPAAFALSDAAGIWDLTMERAAKGLKVRIILRTTPEVRRKLTGFLDVPGLQVRDLEADPIMRFLVVDERELLIWAVNDPSPRLSSEMDVAIWTDAEDFVRTQAGLYDSVWDDARDLRTLAVAEGLLEERPGGGVRR